MLDLGCGDGRLTQALVDAGCTVVGVDGSAEQVAAARARGLDARVMDAQALAFDREFDAVFSNAALHWMKDARAACCGASTARCATAGASWASSARTATWPRSARAVAPTRSARRGLRFDGPRPLVLPHRRRVPCRAGAGRLRGGRDRDVPPADPLPGDVAGWLDTFARAFLAALPAGERPPFCREVGEALAPELRRDGRHLVRGLRAPALPRHEARGRPDDAARSRPVDTAPLLVPIHRELVALLRGLTRGQWLRPTTAGSWRVRDVAAHLLDGQLRRLSFHRDRAAARRRARGPRIRQRARGSSTTLNARWVARQPAAQPARAHRPARDRGRAGRRVPGRAAAARDGLLAGGLGGRGRARRTGWTWAATTPKYWHHQQQIRDAVGAPPLFARRWLAPVVALGVRALPRALGDVARPDGTAVRIVVNGDAGGRWRLVRGGGVDAAPGRRLPRTRRPPSPWTLRSRRSCGTRGAARFSRPAPWSAKVISRSATRCSPPAR